MSNYISNITPDSDGLWFDHQSVQDHGSGYRILNKNVMAYVRR